MNFDIGKYWVDKRAVTVPQCYKNSGLYAIGIAMLCPENNPGCITKKLEEHIKMGTTQRLDLVCTSKALTTMSISPGTFRKHLMVMFPRNF